MTTNNELNNHQQHQEGGAENKHRARALSQISKLHETIDKLQVRHERLRSKSANRAARTAACLWQARAALSRLQKGDTDAQPSVNVKRALLSAKRGAREAGLVEDEAERRLWDTDSIMTDGDSVVRTHRKALVLRIQRLMKKASKLAKPGSLTAELEKTVAGFPQPEQPESSSSEEKESSSAEEEKEASPMAEESIAQADATASHDMMEETDLSDSAPANTHEQQNEKEEEDEEEDEDNDDKHHSPERFTPVHAKTRPAWNPTFTQHNGRGGSVLLRASLPNVASRNLSVTVDERTRKLKVGALSRSHGKFEREFSVSRDFDILETRAGLEDGELTITLVPAEEEEEEEQYAPFHAWGRRPASRGYSRPQPRTQHHGYSPFRGFGGFGGFGGLAW